MIKKRKDNGLASNETQKKRSFVTIRNQLSQIKRSHAPEPSDIANVKRSSERLKRKIDALLSKTNKKSLEGSSKKSSDGEFESGTTTPIWHSVCAKPDDEIAGTRTSSIMNQPNSQVSLQHVNWKNFNMFNARDVCESDDDDDIVVVPQICQNPQQVAEKMKKMIQEQRKRRSSAFETLNKKPLQTVSDDDEVVILGEYSGSAKLSEQESKETLLNNVSTEKQNVSQLKLETPLVEKQSSSTAQNEGVTKNLNEEPKQSSNGHIVEEPQASKSMESLVKPTLMPVSKLYNRWNQSAGPSTSNASRFQPAFHRTSGPLPMFHLNQPLVQPFPFFMNFNSASLGQNEAPPYSNLVESNMPPPQPIVMPPLAIQKTMQPPQPDCDSKNIRLLRPFKIPSYANQQTLSQVGFKLRICSFNVLCEETKKKCPYLYVDEQQKITWEQRKQLLLDDITMLNADIYCLQEVQLDHYTDFFEPLFYSVGFKCYFTQRSGNENVDGCMMAYRIENFVDSNFEHIYYNYNVDGFDKNNVGQMFELQEKRTGLRFVVANTHILFNMRRGDIKTGQVAILLATIEQHCRELRKSDKFSGILLCGDFNIDPKSPIYWFIRNGVLDYSTYKFETLAHSTAICSGNHHTTPSFIVNEGVPLDPTTCKLIDTRSESMRKRRITPTLYHTQRFLSAYRHTTDKDEPEISTFHAGFGCPDFIFYSGFQSHVRSGVVESRIMIQKTLVLPSLMLLCETCGRMPNYQCGSDHLPLMAEFFVC